jgi:uncharacterized delta-60 repeat protein
MRMNLQIPKAAATFLSVAALTCLAPVSHAQTPGDEDTSFATGPTANSTILALALQPNGQVLAGGIFTAFRGAARNEVARLNPDGSLDSFDPGLALSGYNGASPAVSALALQPNGQVIVAGIFNVLNQQPGGGVLRLNPDGSLDSTFDAGTGVYNDGDVVGQADVVTVLPSGQILVGGAFQSFNGVPLAGLVRLNPDGSVDPTFNPGGEGITANSYGGDVKTIVALSNGQILIGGHFSAYNGTSAGCVARLNANGTLDPTFNVGIGADVAVYTLAVQANGQVLAGGGFNDFDNATIDSHLVRLNTDGSLDTSYSPNLDLFIAEVDCIVVQPNGEAVIGGEFLVEGGFVNSPAVGLARVFANGAQDTAFNAGSGSGYYQALALVLQPNGELLTALDIGAGYSYPSDVYRIYDITAPKVTIAPGVDQTKESGGGPATFVVKLSAAAPANLTIHYTIMGSAKNGVDYTMLPGTLKIPAGATSKKITVVPHNRGIKGGDKVVNLTLKAGSGYTLGTEKEAKVKIVDNH